MTSRIPVRRLSQSVRTLPRPAGEVRSQLPPQSPAREPELPELAKEIVEAFNDELDKYRKSLGSRWPRPDPSQPPTPQSIEELFAKPADSVTFFDLERMTQCDSARALARSKLNPWSSSATWMTPPELTT